MRVGTALGVALTTCLLIGCRSDGGGCETDGDVAVLMVIRTVQDARSCRGVRQVLGDLIITANATNHDLPKGEPGYYYKMPENEDLTDLDDLSDLRIVGGNVEIEDNLGLTDVTGLSAIEKIEGGVLVEGNTRLSDLTGLVEHPMSLGFAQVEGDIEEVGLAGVTKLERLTVRSTTAYSLDQMAGTEITEKLTISGSATRIEGLLLGDLDLVSISDNSELETLDLPSLRETRGLEVLNNAALVGIVAPKLTSIRSVLEVKNNRLLPTDVVEGLADQANPEYVRTCGNLGQEECQ